MQKFGLGAKKKLEIVLIFVQIVKIPAFMKKGVKPKHRLSKVALWQKLYKIRNFRNSSQKNTT